MRQPGSDEARRCGCARPGADRSGGFHDPRLRPRPGRRATRPSHPRGAARRDRLPGPSVQRSDALRDRCRLRSGDAPPDSAAGLRPARHRRQTLPSPRQRQAARDAEVAQAPGGRDPRDRGELNALDRAPKGPRAVRAPPGAPGPPEALEHRRPAPRVCRRPPSAGSRRRRGGGGAAGAHFAIETYENGRDE